MRFETFLADRVDLIQQNRFNLSGIRSKFLPILLILCLTGGAAAQGLPAEGRKIAERWCAECHQVSDDQATANTEAPAFANIAKKYPDEDGLAALAAFLADPHPVMPNMSLTRRAWRKRDPSFVPESADVELCDIELAATHAVSGIVGR